MYDPIKRSAQLVLVAAVVLGFGAALLSTPAAAQDGKTLFTQKGCPACHGPNGDKPLMPVYAKLAGQNAEYIVVQLKAFKAQERKSGQSALMWGMAAQLNDKEMDAIAKWLSKQKGGM
jgi:cytochrome c